MATQCRLSLPFDCVTFYDCLRTLIVLFFGAHITGSPPTKFLCIVHIHPHGSHHRSYTNWSYWVCVFPYVFI